MEKDELTIKLVDTLLKYGHQNRASDIHVEPLGDNTRVRFRIDGVMHDVLSISNELAEFILIRIKVLSKIRIDEHQAAQDGKFRFTVEEDVIDVRVSIVPITEGENIVMRLLSSKVGNLV